MSARGIPAAVAAGLLICSAIPVISYLIVCVPGARAQGYRLWSRRRLRGLRTGSAECIGGPLDGQSLPVRRLALTGVILGAWPDVQYDTVTATYRLAERPIHGRCARPDIIWAGYYEFRFMSDRYQWVGTGLERFANLYAGGAL